MVCDTGPIDKQFFAIIADMQNFSPLLEDAILKGTKMHTHFKTLLQSYSLFWESIHKLADLGALSQGCSKPLGACLSRLCTKMTTQELKLRQVCNHLMSSTLQPLQDELEDWKKQVNQLEKDHHKEMKSIRNNYKRATLDWQRLNKKNSGGGDLIFDGGDLSDVSRRCSMPIGSAIPTGRRSGEPGATADKKLLAAWQEYSKQKHLLQDRQKEFLRRAIQMDRQRYVTLWHSMRPLMDSFVSSIQEMCHLEENVNQLNNFINATMSTSSLDDPMIEQRIKELTCDNLGDQCEAINRDSITSSSYAHDRLSLSSGSSGGAGGRSIPGSYSHSLSGLGPASRHSSTTSLTSYSSLVSGSGDCRTPRDLKPAHTSTNIETGESEAKNGTISNFFSSGRVPSLTSQDSGIASNRDPEYAVCGILQSRNAQSTCSVSDTLPRKVDNDLKESGSEDGSTSDEEEQSSSSDTANGILEVRNSTEFMSGTVRSLRGCSDAIQSLEAVVARHTISGGGGHMRPMLSASTFEPCQPLGNEPKTCPPKYGDDVSSVNTGSVMLRNPSAAKPPPPPPVRRDSPYSNSPGFNRRGSCVSPGSKSETYSNTAMLFKQSLTATLSKPSDPYSTNSTFGNVDYACQSMGRFSSSAYTSQHFPRDFTERHSMLFDKCPKSPTLMERDSLGHMDAPVTASGATKANFLAELKLAQQTRHVTTAALPPPSTKASDKISQYHDHHHQHPSSTLTSFVNNAESNQFLAALRKSAQQLKSPAICNDRSAPCLLPDDGL